MKLFRNLLILSLIGLAAFFLPWSRIDWGKLQLSSSPSITVYGYAQNQERNQIAVFSAGVQAVNDDKQTAVDEVNNQIAKIINAVKDFGIDEADIKTQNMSIYQAQETFYEDGRQKQRAGQWHVNNTIEVKLRDVDQASELADILVSNGSTNVNGPSFQLDDRTSSEDALLEQAIDNARDKAERVAKANNQSLGKMVNVVEGASSSSIYPALLRDGAGGGGYPAEPGTSSTSKTVTVTFELK